MLHDWNRFFFAPEGATGAGTGGTPPPGAGASDATPPATGATVTPPAPEVPAVTEPPAGPAPAGKTMTQDEFDRALAARLKKYSDYDEMKNAAARLKVIEDANKTEVEKLREQATQAQARAQQLEANVRESTMRGAVIAEAARQGFADPMDAYRLLDVAKMELSEDGVVKGLSDALTALATSKPYLRQRNAPPVVPATNPPRDSGVPGRTDEDRRRDYFGGGRSDFWHPEPKG